MSRKSWAEKMDRELEDVIEDRENSKFVDMLVDIVRTHMPKRKLSDIEDRVLSETMSMLGTYIVCEVGYKIRHEWEERYEENV